MDKGAKATGLLVFLAGIVMMVIVFVSAMHMLGDARTLSVEVKRLPQTGVSLLARIGFLFVLGYIASAVAGRGIHLFEAAAPVSGADKSGGTKET